MNKYIYSECTEEYWPSLKSLLATSYQNGIEKLINYYSHQFDDDKILDLDNIKALQEYLNEKYNFVISDLEDIEEL